MNCRYLVSLTALLVAACATPNVSQDYRLNPSSNDGVVMGSVTYSGRYSGYSVEFRQVPTGQTGRFQTGESVALIPQVPKGDFGSAAPRGTVFAAALAAGDYEIYEWKVGSGYANVRSTAPFSIRFKVEPGKLVYLGNFHFTQTSGMGLMVTGAMLSYAEKHERDIAAFKAKFPALAEFPIAYAVAPGTNEEWLGGRSSTTITVPVFVPIGKGR
jgi:hypothetical protein